jgi:hypothetical protein
MPSRCTSAMVPVLLLSFGLLAAPPRCAAAVVQAASDQAVKSISHKPLEPGLGPNPVDRILAATPTTSKVNLAPSVPGKRPPPGLTTSPAKQGISAILSTPTTGASQVKSEVIPTKSTSRVSIARCIESALAIVVGVGGMLSALILGNRLRLRAARSAQADAERENTLLSVSMFEICEEPTSQESSKSVSSMSQGFGRRPHQAKEAREPLLNAKHSAPVLMPSESDCGPRAVLF